MGMWILHMTAKMTHDVVLDLMRKHQQNYDQKKERKKIVRLRQEANKSASELLCMLREQLERRAVSFG